MAGQYTSALEIAAMITGLIGVWFTVKENVWCFPIGIVNVSLYAYLFLTPGVRLYADALLQCIYIVLLFYGWKNWLRKDRVEKEFVTRVQLKTKINLVIIFLLSTAALYLFLLKFTDASLPLVDSSLTCASLIAQWMIAKKNLENWILWIIVDAIYLPVYILKKLPLTAGLYFIFLIMAVLGYYKWKKDLARA